MKDDPSDSADGLSVAPVSLDRIDHALLSLLRADGRASISALAAAVHISRANAYNRFNRLLESGVLEGFSAVVNHQQTGLLSSAYVTLKVKQNSWRSLKRELQKIPEVHHYALVGGEYDVILLVRTTDNEHLRQIVFDRLQAIQGVLDSQTSLIFEDGGV